jgi:hypothetical protein
MAAILLVGLTASLAGCGPAKDQFAPACPRADLLWQAADLTRYRDEAATATQDIRNLELSARIMAVQGKCEAGDDAKHIAADITVFIQYTRGPAMQGRAANVPFFLAITQGEQIDTEKLYMTQVVFPTNVDQVTLGSQPVHMVFPVSSTKSGAAYTVLAGFQLTPDELAYNRRHAAARP